MTSAFAEPEPNRSPRPTRVIPAARKDNIILSRLMTAPQGRTVAELCERLIDERWATRDNVYLSLQRLHRRGLVVRQLTPQGHLYAAVAPDPDDPLEQAFRATSAPEVDAPEVNVNDRTHKTRRDRYTHEEIVAAILRWADSHDGEPPCQASWNPALLRTLARRMAVKAVGHLGRIAEYDSDDWPSSTTVVKYFGSWNAALAAAGFHGHLRSSGNQPREGDLSLLPGTGAADELEKLLDAICRSHHENERDELRSALLDLSLAARDWAMRISQRDRLDAA